MLPMHDETSRVRNELVPACTEEEDTGHSESQHHSDVMGFMCS
jgi:hypothetical protein